MHAFSDEVGGTFGAGPVGGFENDPVPKIQHGDFGFIFRSKGGEK